MDDRVATFCRVHHIRQLSLFGSALRDEMTEDSDIDLLVEFEEGHVPGLFGIVRMERELSGLLDGMTIDLRTPGDLSRYFRDEVIKSSVVIYAAA
jgi:predicted nucleotidyltransferase